MQATKRTFTVGKAILECVQNSIDAGATKVEITADQQSLVVQDDGHGFRTREEIEQYFEVFGFDHAGMERVYGKFGIGRGQLWAFASTNWITNQFEMRVDIRKTGLTSRML